LLSILTNTCEYTRSLVASELYIITLRIEALSLVESHDLLEDRRTELRHTKPYPIAFPYLYRSCTRDICKISTFSNLKMFGWIKSKLFTCIYIRGGGGYFIIIYYIKQINKILPLSVQLYRAGQKKVRLFELLENQN
jgi:hypothetical protein